MRKFIYYIGLISLLTGLLSSCANDIETVDNPSKDSTIHFTTKISIEDAQSDLESLLKDLDASKSRSKDAPLCRKIKSSYSIPISSTCSRAGESDSTVIYVFNFENNEGYAIMSGDNSLPSLIALTDSGSLEEGEEIDNPGVALFLEGMDNMCYAGIPDNTTVIGKGDAFGEDNGPYHGYSKYGEWENIVYNQYGVCPVKWGQGDPYNKYCPIINNAPTLTGCVATAVAQLMAIYKYPESYDNYSFSWKDMMSSKYGINCSDKGQDNIARLMKQLGLQNNLDTSYGNEASGAKTENIIRTLKSFGYSQPGTLKEYNTDDVVAELKNGYGVLISGYSDKIVTRLLGIKVKTEYSGGHQWLAHGLIERRREIKHYDPNGCLVGSSYETQWYPLCNWGWGGNRDGYYLSAAFDTNKGCVFPDGEPSSRSGDSAEGSSAYNYQFNISAITGIRK